MKAPSETFSPRSTGPAASRRNPGSCARQSVWLDCGQSQGKRRDAYELLAPVYDWFTEGFDTKDLLDAKALLDELTS